MIHVLKTWPEPFEAMWIGDKTAEFRKNDRQYQLGDRLALLEYDPEKDMLSGREITGQITDIRSGPAFGIPEGFVVMSVARHRGTDCGGLAWEIGDGKDFRTARIADEG